MAEEGVGSAEVAIEYPNANTLKTSIVSHR